MRHSEAIMLACAEYSTAHPQDSQAQRLMGIPQGIQIGRTVTPVLGQDRPRSTVSSIA
jgi:hypothetical protein